MDIVSYILSKKYTDTSLIGGGAIKGKNCTVDSITSITGGNRVTFKWTLDDGTVQTGYIDVMDGSNEEITSVSINSQNHFIVTYSNGTTHDCGAIQIVNVQSDWNQTDTSENDYIKNKPNCDVKTTTSSLTTMTGGVLLNCVVELSPVQSGSGNPSPENIRPFVIHSEIKLENRDNNGVLREEYTCLCSQMYGGTYNLVTGEALVTYAHITSYNGETITEPWLSDRDVYVSGTTPTIGAEVIYVRETPAIRSSWVGAPIKTLIGENNFSCVYEGQAITLNGISYRDVLTLEEIQIANPYVVSNFGDMNVIANVVTGDDRNQIINTGKSFAEGEKNIISSAPNAHAEGYNNKIYGGNSHAEGTSNTVHSYASHAEGYNNEAGTYNEQTGYHSGEEIHVEGGYNTASASYSHAEGYSNTASGRTSHAEGQRTEASGEYSHTEGVGTIASNYSAHAGGNKSTASGNGSFAHGFWAQATNDFSVGLGIANKELDSINYPNGYTLFSIGKGTANTLSVTERKNVFEVRSNGTVLEGTGCTANGASAHAEGNATYAQGQNSHAEGNDSHANGYAAHAEGSHTYAVGQDSHAENSYAEARGISSHAEGNATHANGNNSHAGGYASTAANINSFVHGNTVTANNDNMAVFGKFNSQVLSTDDPNAYTIFAVGNGADASHKENAFEVRSNGDVLANNSKLISVSELQTIVASCTDFSDFKAAIAAL